MPPRHSPITSSGSYDTITIMALVYVLFPPPPGRFANLVNWKLLGISKGGWQALHTVMGYLFIVAAVVHLILNWNVFLNYLHSKMKKAINKVWELTASIALILILTIGTIYSWVPFSSIMNLGESLSNSWEAKASETSGTTGKVSASSTASAGESADSEGAAGQGMGRKDLQTVIKENGVSVESALQRLRVKGIDAAPDDNMKALSTKYDIGFNDLIAIITGTP